ncbi:phage tail tape measure protein [Bacteroides sp. ET336]|uniref:phage tail tape measure protein n=1 Tax=Bacteroides sp. ET336 TaxID=2972459 RepID=UPI0021AC5E23|nr:phage tail tape measure protein [Bacteroides sp. ET336]MCR8893469.1 phage tail tape measure protein [Bacteroides sp. ET336]MDN0057966.1 phage tail tape measure protein [Bacteroides caecigallinarum]
MAINETATVEVKVNGEEAKQELKSLEGIASGLKKELAEAYNAGDKSKIKQVTSELRKTEAQIKTLKRDTTALTEVMNNLDKATPKELRATLTAINKQLNSGYIKRGSAEWKMYQQQAKLVTAELQKIKMETMETTSWLERMNNGITKWGGMIATGAAALTGVSFTINKLRSNRDDKEEAQAELKALTGLDDDSIQWLTRQAEILSTSMEESGLRIRQSSDEILQAYMLIGSKKPELLGNKEALNAVTVEAMRLAAAAKIDLKDAVTATTISLNMYGESADQAAKYVNVLAAGSKEGAADVSAQAATIKNAGVAAASAGVSIEQFQGTIQTLAEKGVEAEVAGTALRKFFLVLQTGPDETNPKVVGLQTALENLNKKGMTAGDIQKMFGEEAYTAASILIQNVDAVDRYTQAVTNTNIAVEQAAINSDTNRAKLEQHKNAIKEAGIELAERLNPSIMTLSSLTTKIITVLPKLIDFAIEYRTVIITSTAAIGAYTIAVNAATIKTKLYDTWTKVATTSTAAFNKVLKLNPAGLIIGGITALGTYLITKLVPNTDKATEAQRRYNEELQRTNDELKRYQDIEDRYKNINNLNDRQKQTLKQDAQTELANVEDKLTKETIAYQKYYAEQKKIIMERNDVDESQRQALLKSLSNQAEEKADELEYLLKRKETLKNIISSIKDPEPVKDNVIATVDDNKDKPSAVEVATKAETERYYEELSQLKKSYINSDTMTQKDYQALSEDLERQHLEKMLEIVGLEPEKRRQIQDKLLEMQIQYKEQCKQLDEQEKEENSDIAFSKLEKEAQLKIESATRSHYEGLTSEKEYKQQLLDIQDEFYNQVLASTEISEEKKAEIMNKKQKEGLERSKRNYDEYQAKLKEQISFAQGIGQQFGEVFAEMLTDSEASLGDFMKATLVLILDTLKKTMIAYIAESTMSALAEGGINVFGALAAAAAKTALITAAFETAKAAINGFESGGYTGYGKHDEPKGIVHAGEFVANRYAVSNPSVRPVLDLIDRAQKNNTIGSLTAKDVSAVLSGVSSTTNNTYYQQAAPVDNGMSAVMLEAVKVMGALNKRLNEPIYTYTKATGKMGINEAQDLVTKMKNNASRRIRL